MISTYFITCFEEWLMISKMTTCVDPKDLVKKYLEYSHGNPGQATNE